MPYASCRNPLHAFPSHSYKPLQLVARPKRADCSNRQCQRCLGAWKASEKQDTVYVFFRDPVQVGRCACASVGPCALKASLGGVWSNVRMYGAEDRAHT